MKKIYNTIINKNVYRIILLIILNNSPNYSFSQKKHNNNATNTITIKEKAAIFYYPDHNSIRKTKKKYGSEDFYSGADDNLYYMDIAREFILKRSVRIIEVKTNKILKFIKKNKSVRIIKLKSQDSIFGIILFDGNKNPKAIDMLNPKEEYKKYFTH